MPNTFAVELPDPYALSTRKYMTMNLGNFLTRKEAEIFVYTHITGSYDQTLLDFFIKESNEEE